MIQVEIPRFGPPSVLTPREVPTPEPGPGQVRVAVAAAGVNFADILARMGMYDRTPPLPAVMGWEVGGTIEAVGAGVDASCIGQRVAAVCHFGGYATHVVVDEIQAVPCPDGLDLVQAAALPVHGLSAWMLLEIMGRVRAGDRVLVHSVGGGLGLLCLALLKHRGCWVAGTASAHKHPFLYERGLDLAIDYRNTDFEQALLHQEGFDLVLDPIGGESWAKSYRLLRGGGRLAIYGYSDAARGKTRALRDLIRTMRAVPWLKFNPISIMRANKGLFGMELEHMWDERDRLGQWLTQVLILADEGVMAPVIHATVPLELASEAHRMLQDRENIGKVVLVTGNA